jgi:hypothetical protein
MSVPILAVAFSIYILGIAVILFLRPRIMFKPGGNWKEFGIGRGENYTVIPFWLFAIFWAFISYGVGLVIMSQLANIAMGAFPEHAPQPQMQMAAPQPQQMPPQIQQQPVPPAENFIKPVSSMIGIPQNQPGYYVLQNNGGPAPQYVYYGTSPPAFSRA